jgi:hypothetical protein
MSLDKPAPSAAPSTASASPATIDPMALSLSFGEPAGSDEHGGTITMSGERQGRDPMRSWRTGLFRQATVTRARHTRSPAHHACKGAGIGITRESE